MGVRLQEVAARLEKASDADGALQQRYVELLLKRLGGDAECTGEVLAAVGRSDGRVGVQELLAWLARPEGEHLPTEPAEEGDESVPTTATGASTASTVPSGLCAFCAECADDESLAATQRPRSYEAQAELLQRNQELEALVARQAAELERIGGGLRAAHPAPAAGAGACEEATLLLTPPPTHGSPQPEAAEATPE
eukprot:CAMPEP_0168481708 /NCGR_PEP_ID=MMETSP0228-20121227/64653_1 /TAXON_ID=133427 /ORGANISM="Protoceratium reticulatum, Strain CCCM 535 (=CCMP 1889)" /LENGTH=194 /DNA_ID=CAMNT_0008498089 /DNA_START=71 /DNA_END=652 /DNA_ORIENTATION=+